MPESFSVSFKHLSPISDLRSSYTAPRAAVVCNEYATRLYLSARPNVDDKGRPLARGDAKAQAEQTFAALAALLQLAGRGPEHLVVVPTSTVSDPAVVATVRDVQHATLGSSYAALDTCAPPVARGHMLSVQAYAVAPQEGQSFRRDLIELDEPGSPNAVELEYGGFRHLYAGGLTGALAAGRSLAEQSVAVFECCDRLLKSAGLTIRDVPRAHIYYDGPYQELRDARHAYLGRCGLTTDELPASTGIYTPVAHGNVAVRLRAVQATGELPLVNRAVAPRTQSEAFAYGSLFTRARWVETDIAELEVSGTASMGRDGKVKYSGKPRAQTRKAHENVLDLLDACGLSYRHCVRHISYLLHPRHRRTWEAVFEQTSMGAVETPPLMQLQTGICWGKLLVEDEVTAVAARG